MEQRNFDYTSSIFLIYDFCTEQLKWIGAHSQHFSCFISSIIQRWFLFLLAFFDIFPIFDCIMPIVYWYRIEADFVWWWHKNGIFIPFYFYFSVDLNKICTSLTLVACTELEPWETQNIKRSKAKQSEIWKQNEQTAIYDGKRKA